MVLRLIATVINVLFMVLIVLGILTANRTEDSNNGVLVVFAATLLLNSCLIWS